MVSKSVARDEFIEAAIDGLMFDGADARNRQSAWHFAVITDPARSHNALPGRLKREGEVSGRVSVFRGAKFRSAQVPSVAVGRALQRLRCG
jgi:hypothetical protein